jgi:hypothetical protein
MHVSWSALHSITIIFCVLDFTNMRSGFCVVCQQSPKQIAAAVSKCMDILISFWRRINEPKLCHACIILCFNSVLLLPPPYCSCFPLHYSSRSDDAVLPRTMWSLSFSLLSVLSYCCSPISNFFFYFSSFARMVLKSMVLSSRDTLFTIVRRKIWQWLRLVCMHGVPLRLYHVFMFQVLSFPSSFQNPPCFLLFPSFHFISP